jgi:hypothetical protein
MITPTSFLGMCPECLNSKLFGTERERDQWEHNHPHDGEVGSDV